MIDQTWRRIIANFEGIVSDLDEARDKDHIELALRLRYITSYLVLSMIPAMLNFADQLAPMPGAGSAPEGASHE